MCKAIYDLSFPTSETISDRFQTIFDLNMDPYSWVPHQPGNFRGFIVDLTSLVLVLITLPA